MEHDKTGRSLLLYAESRCVDGRGFLDGRNLNAEDRDRLKEWNASGYVEYGRVPMEVIQSRTGSDARQETEWCRLSDEAWTDAARLRRERGDRGDATRIERHGEFDRWSKE